MGKKLNKKKIIIIICFLLIIVIGIIIGSSINNQSNKNEEINITVDGENEVSRLENIYKKIMYGKNYSFSLKLNDDNYKNTQKNKNSVRVCTKDEGKEEEYIIKNGNTYVVSSNKEYKNNETMLNDVEDKFQDVIKRKFEVGKERIDGKEYLYEEFNNTSVFLINYKGKIDNNNTKTRFYYEEDNLKYIKTYVKDVEQLLKVDLEFNNQNGEYSI